MFDLFLENRRGRVRERQRETVRFREVERQAGILEHVLEREIRLEVPGDHRRQLQVGRARARGVIFQGLDQLGILDARPRARARASPRAFARWWP